MLLIQLTLQSLKMMENKDSKSGLQEEQPGKED